MSVFHRFVDPTYYLFPGESFPAAPGGTGTIGLNTYDRVNVESGGAGGGDSSNADDQKAAAPNQYTYFIGFGETATSLHVNRGLRAAFESLDSVDNTLRASVPSRYTQSDTNPAAASIPVVGDVYVGRDPMIPASSLVAITTQDGKTPLNGTTPVAVIDIQDGGGGSVIGQEWYTNPTIVLNTSMVQDYTITYGGRSSLARFAQQDQDAWWTLWFQSFQDAVRLDQLFGFGLDEKYRHATSPSSADSQLDTPGAGAVWTATVRPSQACCPP